MEWGDWVNPVSGDQWSALEITTSGSPLQLLFEIANGWPPPFAFLYVLVVTRDEEWEPSRYQSEWFDDIASVRDALVPFTSFLEGDGRHELWLFASTVQKQIVWSRHDILHVYGDDERTKERLVAQGYRAPVRAEIPVPHSHHYHAEYDGDFLRFMREFVWSQSPLHIDDGERR